MIRLIIIILVAGFFSVVRAQLTQNQADSGWVELFDGETLDGLYMVCNGNDLEATNEFFYVDEGTIFVKGSGCGGHIATVETYSYYILKVQFQFTGGGNAGVLYHLREEEPYMDGIYPQSIEYQGQGRGMGEIWTIKDVWVTTTVEDPDARPRKYIDGGESVEHGDPHGRQCLGSSNPYVSGEWNQAEIHVWGADSAHHYANDELVFKLWNIRRAPDAEPFNFDTPHDEGTIGLQSEGAEIRYRNFMIQELDPATLIPINASRGCMDPEAENYDSQAVVDDNSCDYITSAKGAYSIPGVEIIQKGRELHVQSRLNDSFMIRVFNTSGKLVFHKKGSGTEVVEPEGWPGGIYLIDIKTSAGQRVTATRVLF